MLIRAKAPLRVSFAGGGTDVPPFPAEEGGLVLNATINRYAWGTLRTRDDRPVSIHSVDFGLSETFGVDERFGFDGKLDLAKAAIRQFAGRLRLRPAPALERPAGLGARLLVGDDGRADRRAQGAASGCR